jgi:hypothetical protein
MWWTILVKIVWAIMERFISDAAQKAKWEAKIERETKRYQQGVEDSAKLKVEHEDLKKKMKEKRLIKWPKV